MSDPGTSDERRTGLPSEAWAWLVLGLLTLACFAALESAPWLKDYPDAWVVPLGDAINTAMEWFVDTFKWLFRGLSWLLGWPMTWVQWLLQALPWPAVIALFALLAHRLGGGWLTAFTTLSLVYMLVVGYWAESMNTLSLVAVSVPLSIAVGLVLGIAAYRSPRVDRFVQPTLDLMQTVPAFAYLIPILFLFGFGPVVGLIASAIYAAPPMVRNIILGLKQVPSDIVESGDMSGCTPRQRFWMVELPTAMPQVMVGVNQTTMAALSMVIIAAIIGGFDDIGWEVLSTMRKAQFGQSLLSGMVIALLAMMLDRLSIGLSRQSDTAAGARVTLMARHGHLIIAVAVTVGLVLLSRVVPVLAVYPESWVWYPADQLNDGVRYVVRNYSGVMDSLKNNTMFFVLLPIRIGFVQAVSPYSWGIELTSTMVWGYAVGAAVVALLLGRRFGWRAGVAVVLAAVLLFYGTTGTPWPVFMGVITLLAWQAGGPRVAIFALGSMLFMLLNGVWKPAMLSIYLCGAAVMVSFVAGGLIGIWAAHNDTVSRIVRPINDTLQTMPQFVLLIPVLMLFKVGEFSALLAVIAYAIVPPIRYFEHGLRNVSPAVVEAAKQIGCSTWQVLFEVKLPMALPVIMLGLNQTINYGLGMLVIAALVGTQGLGQAVYLALGKADMGKGVITGLSIALVAMVADQILQAMSRRRQEALGL